MLAAAGIVVVIAAITMDVTIRRVWESSLREEIQRGLTARARLFADRVEIAHQESLQDITSQEALAAGARATVIDPTGQVLADSEADAKSMENHRGRKEFMAALAGNIGVDERRSHTIGVPYLYVAVPVSGGAVRMAYQLSDVEAASQRIHRALLLGSLIAFVIIMLLAALAAHYTARRLQRILRFAERVSAGDLTARISATSLDEIGQVATALDKTARRVEESFLAVQTSQRQLETLLNSMQDAVIAVGSDGRVQWANRGMERLVPQRTRLNAPVVETVRDPQFLAAVRDATEGKKIASARAGSIVPGRSFDVTAAPLPGGGAVAVLRDLTETERVEKTRRDFIANAGAEAIHQVFSNLIENAMKYAGSGKRILLGARSVERGVEFYVRDFGPGIPSEHLPRLFERFYRVDKARSRESGGTGLGLAIAKHIVLAHHGSIRAESELNQGSTFLFVLPASQPRTTLSDT